MSILEEVLTPLRPAVGWYLNLWKTQVTGAVAITTVLLWLVGAGLLYPAIVAQGLPITTITRSSGVSVAAIGIGLTLLILYPLAFFGPAIAARLMGVVTPDTRICGKVVWFGLLVAPPILSAAPLWFGVDVPGIVGPIAFFTPILLISIHTYFRPPANKLGVFDSVWKRAVSYFAGSVGVWAMLAAFFGRLKTPSAIEMVGLVVAFVVIVAGNYLVSQMAHLLRPYVSLMLFTVSTLGFLSLGESEPWTTLASTKLFESMGFSLPGEQSLTLRESSCDWFIAKGGSATLRGSTCQIDGARVLYRDSAIVIFSTKEVARIEVSRSDVVGFIAQGDNSGTKATAQRNGSASNVP